jgi:hypothetical protein
MRTHYGLLKQVYKWHSGILPSSNVPSIGQNILTEIVIGMANNFLDYKNLRLSDVDLHVVTLKANGARSFGKLATNPERQLVRHQFMEIMFKIALERHKGMAPAVALNKMFVQNLAPAYSGKYDSHRWRCESLWTEQCDRVIKDNLKLIKDVFQVWTQYLP